MKVHAPFVHLQCPQNGLIEYQGHIVCSGSRYLIVQLYSWITGNANGTMRLSTHDFWQMKPKFFPSAAEMRRAHDQAGNRYRFRRGGAR